MATYDEVFNRRLNGRLKFHGNNRKEQRHGDFPFYAKFKCVYFVKCGDFVKIGSTKCLYQRLVSIKVDNISPEFVGVLIRDNHTTLEKEIHKQFEKHWIKGEWYRYNDEIENYLNLNMNDDDKMGVPLYKEFVGFQQGHVSKNQRDFLRVVERYNESEWIKS